MNTDRIHPAKVILFGEYSVLLGSAALGIPYRTFGATLAAGNANPGHPALSQQESRNILEKFIGYLQENNRLFRPFLELSRLVHDFNDGMYLRSSIPPGRGLGSSGALCAALFARYGRGRPVDWSAQKQLLGSMESHFHGTSSGFDPLISLLDRPLWLTQDGRVEIRLFSPRVLNRFDIYLVDLGSPAGTGNLVGDFLDRHMHGGRPTAFGQALAAVTDRCIEGLMNEDAAAFRTHLATLSRMQEEGLPGLVPGHARELWKEGLESGSFTMKLCGSGGGGHFILFIHDHRRARQILRDVLIHKIYSQFVN